MWGVNLIVHTEDERKSDEKKRQGQRQKVKKMSVEMGKSNEEVKSPGERTSHGTINVDTDGEWMRVKKKKEII